MTHPIYSSREHTYKREDDDLNDYESDTTKFSLTAETLDKTHLLPKQEGLDLSASALAQRRAAKRAQELSSFWTLLRWGFLVGLQTIIILLLSVSHNDGRLNEKNPPDFTAGDPTVETGGDINGLYKTCESTFFCFYA